MKVTKAISSPRRQAYAPGARSGAAANDEVFIPAPGPLGYATDYANLRRHISRGRALQAQQMAAVAIATATFLKRVAQATRQRLRCWRAARVARHELERLDDRVLRDIGITREKIAGVVDGLLPAAHVDSTARALESVCRRAREKPGRAAANDADASRAA